MLYGVGKRRPFCVGDRGAAEKGFGLCFESGVSESDGGGAAGWVPKGPCVCISVLSCERDGQKSVRAERCGRAGRCGRHVVLAGPLHCWGSGAGASRGLRRDEGPGAAGEIKI